MQRATFKPEFAVVGRVEPVATIEALDAATGVYAASPEFAIKHGGPIVASILNGVPESYFAECEARGLLPNIDVRIHRLYPGVYPAFPGWHCDAEFRETYFAQPDLARTPVSKSVVCTVSSHAGGVSNTEFLLEEFKAEIDPGADFAMWRGVHEQVENERKRRERLAPFGDMKTWVMPDGQLTQFSNLTLHRARPAHTRGWRLFFRMSMWHKPYLGEGGKIAKQEMVYQVLESLGW